MKLKKIMATMLSIMTVATGVVGVSASASSHSYNYSLGSGATGYTSFYDTNGSSYGSVQPTDSGLSSSNFYNVAFCDESFAYVTAITSMKATNAKYHLDYTKTVPKACLKIMNTSSSRSVSGKYDPAGSI